MAASLAVTAGNVLAPLSGVMVFAFPTTRGLMYMTLGDDRQA